MAGDDATIFARAQWTLDRSRLLRAECASRRRDAFGLRLGARQTVIDIMLIWDQVVRRQEIRKRAHQNPAGRRKVVVDLNEWRKRRGAA